MRLHVIAGRLKGARLKVGRGSDLRPSSGRLREALFSILAGGLEGAAFLDLYAGTGAVGIEALSRGAARAVFVELDPAAARNLRANLAACGLDREAEVLAMGAPTALRNLEQRGDRFGVIFADPPYDYPALPRLLDGVSKRAVLEEDGLFVLERPAGESPRLAAGLQLARCERYGGSSLLFYQRSP